MTEQVRPSDTLKPLQEAARAIVSDENRGHPRRAEYDAKLKAAHDAENAILDSLSARLARVEAYCTADAKDLGDGDRSRRLATAARTFLSPAPTQPADEWPKFTYSPSLLSVYVYPTPTQCRVYSDVNTGTDGMVRRYFDEVDISHREAVAKFPVVGDDFPLKDQPCKQQESVTEGVRYPECDSPTAPEQDVETKAREWAEAFLHYSKNAGDVIVRMGAKFDPYAKIGTNAGQDLKVFRGALVGAASSYGHRILATHLTAFSATVSKQKDERIAELEEGGKQALQRWRDAETDVVHFRTRRDTERARANKLEAASMELEAKLAAMTKERDDYKRCFYERKTAAQEYLDECNKLTKDRDKWRSNHDEMVARNAVLRNRPDLPIERVKGYDELQAKLSAMTKRADAQKRLIEAHQWYRRRVVDTDGMSYIKSAQDDLDKLGGEA